MEDMKDSFKACKRKRQFATPKEAQWELDHQLVKIGSYYKCEHCHMYHITKQASVPDYVWKRLRK